MSNSRLPPPFAATRAFFFHHFTWGQPPPSTCYNENDDSEQEYSSECESSEAESSEETVQQSSDPNDYSMNTNVAYKNSSDQSTDPLAIGPSTISRLSDKQRTALEKERRHTQQHWKATAQEPTFTEMLHTRTPAVATRTAGRFISSRRFNNTRSYRKY